MKRMQVWSTEQHIMLCMEELTLVQGVARKKGDTCVRKDPQELQTGTVIRCYLGQEPCPVQNFPRQGASDEESGRKEHQCIHRKNARHPVWRAQTEKQRKRKTGRKDLSCFESFVESRLRPPVRVVATRRNVHRITRGLGWWYHNVKY